MHLALTLTLILLHKWERQHLLDAILVRQEHDHPIDTHAPAPRRRQPELHRVHERLVNDLRLVVSLLLLPRLLLETQALVEGVVQLRVGIDDLLLADEGFEALAEAAHLPVVFG